jgi:hypothetical protein
VLVDPADDLADELPRPAAHEGGQEDERERAERDGLEG